MWILAHWNYPRYKTIKKRQVEDFLTTIIHEIYHAMDLRNMVGKSSKKCMNTR